MLVRLSVLLELVLLLAAPAVGQDAPAKDPQGLTVLTQMAAATGWVRSNLPTDVLARGNVTRYNGVPSSTFPLTMKAKGPHKFRLEAQDGLEMRTTIVNAPRGSVGTPSDSHAIPAHSAVFMRPYEFPFFTKLLVSDDPDIAVIYEGMEPVGAESAHRVLLYREPGPNVPNPEPYRRASAIRVWVSAVSALPLRVQHAEVSFDNPSAMLTVTRQLSQYGRVQGVLVPLRQDRLVGEQLTYTLQLTDVQFNVGLSDSEFQVAE